MMKNKDKNKLSAFLAKDIEFEGVLKFYGTIRIDGHFKGEILGEGNLIVGKEATIESDIHVSNVLNNGLIQGNVIADEKIEILSPGKVIGNIEAPRMVINEGSIIEGNCLMSQAEKREEKKLTVISSDESGGSG
jgi:cytoskeletal protein CcmA (bactofilin family)